MKYEYVFIDEEETQKVFDIDHTIKVNQSSFYSESNQYDYLVYFMHKGIKNIVSVLNKRNLVFYTYTRRTSGVKVLPMPYEVDIMGIQRYSAYVMIQYPKFVEFMSLDEKELMEPIYKISQNDPIVSI